MRSMASHATRIYRTTPDTAAALAKLFLKSRRFAPQVILPGSDLVTVLEFQDGSLAAATPGHEAANVRTITSAEHTVVAADALNGPNSRMTRDWSEFFWKAPEEYVSPSLCGHCHAYRAPVGTGAPPRPCRNGCPEP